MASLHSPPVYSRKRAIRYPTVPFPTVEDDPRIAPAPKLPAQLLVTVQTGAGNDEEKHAYDPASRSFEVIGPYSPSGISESALSLGRMTPRG